MGKRAREQKRNYRRTALELLGALRERLELIVMHCSLYDSGKFSAAKPLAVDLRILLHDQGHGTSLLTQLGVRSRMQFEDSCGPWSPKLISASGALAIMSASPGWGDWLPLFERRTPLPPRLVDRSPKQFDTWWTEPVLKDTEGRAFSRRTLTLSLCNQDGGAHIDGGLADDYAALSRQNSMGVEWVGSLEAEAPGRPLSSPVPASIRQIGHEVVRSAQWWMGDALLAGDVPAAAVRQVLAPLDEYTTPVDPDELRKRWPVEERPT